ncbi:MAG TPA: hypothetical protein VFX62_03555 [Erythrobacter sp.]|nr:hypothetical protein [Erythrobacter sp.]
MPGLNDLLAPDMQKILLFVLPLLATISVLTMNLSRGFSTPGKVLLVICALTAAYFLPQFLEVF